MRNMNINKVIGDGFVSLQNEVKELRRQLASSDAALIESRANDMESMRQLSAAKAENEALRTKLATEEGTTGNKYRAELYDEVWHKAKTLGYANVTDALDAIEALQLRVARMVEALNEIADRITLMLALRSHTHPYSPPLSKTTKHG